MDDENKRISFKGELVGGEQVGMRNIEALEMETKELEEYMIFSLEEEKQEKVEVSNLRMVCELVDLNKIIH